MGGYVGLKKWELFRDTDVKILTQFKLCHLFSETRTDMGAIFVDEFNQAFAKGYNNKFNKLGIGSHHIGVADRNGGVRFKQSVQIPQLSGENITSILTGYRHGAAMSESGNVFFWGLDLSCETYSERMVTKAPKLINKGELMNGERAKQIACSGNALGIITTTGKLLVWGLWQGPNSATVLKGEVEIDTEPRSIVGGGWHFAVNTNQCLYTFGDGGSGQLGYEWDCTKDSYIHPKMVDLPEPVLSVACSQSATLAYLRPWSLYVFGDNTQGRLGVNSKESVIHTPTKINLSEPIVYVLASLHDNLLYAVTATTNRLYRWGYDASLVKPEAVEGGSIIEAFANRAIPVSDALVDADSASAPGLVPDISSTGQPGEFSDNDEFADLTIKLKDGDVKAHRIILHSRSDYFKGLLSSNWIEGQKRVVDMTSYEPKAYRAYLNYIYNGVVDRLEPHSLVQLYVIADQYLDNKLKEYCHNKFKSLITVQTVGELYRGAEEHSCNDLAGECYAYAIKNMDQLADYLKSVNLESYLLSLLSL